MDDWFTFFSTEFCYYFKVIIGLFEAFSISLFVLHKVLETTFPRQCLGGFIHFHLNQQCPLGLSNTLVLVCSLLLICFGVSP